MIMARCDKYIIVLGLQLNRKDFLKIRFSVSLMKYFTNCSMFCRDIKFIDAQK